jgi:cell division protein FtsZ
MMINVSMADPDHNLRPRLTVIGVGGAGGNAINNMIRCGLEGCDFLAANTDSQALAMSLAPRKIQLGINLSRGLGAGSKPDIGRAAAEEQMNDIIACLEGSDMVFVTAGMGGGTGTGAAPVIARAAREAGILTVGVVTKPFHFEGSNRMKSADNGINELQQFVDTLIVIPNQNLFRIANERTTFAEAFRLADEVLHCGVRGITDLMVMPGFMNLDFADVKTVMGEMGKAMMGTGEAEGDNRAIRAAEAAISNPLLDDVSMKGARGVLINITGGDDMTLFEVDQAANRIREEVDPDAQIKVGSTLGENLEGCIRVSVIATGIDAVPQAPVQQRSSQSSTGGVSPQHLRVAAENIAKAAPKQQAQSSTQYFTMPQAALPHVVAQQPAAPIRVQVQAQQQPAHVQTVVQQQAQPQQQRQQPQQQAHRAAPPQQQHEEEMIEEEVEQVQQQPQPQATQQARAPRPQTYSSIRTSNLPQTRQTAQAPARNGSAQVDTRVTQISAPAQNAADQRRMRRSESLFTRITGFGLVRPSSQQQQDEDAVEEMQLADEAIAAQDAHLEVDPSDRPAQSAEQSGDLLDIPAFLRRQNNH